MHGAMTEAKRSASPFDHISTLHQVARSDPEAISQFYRTYANAVFRFVYRRLAERYEDAEEITQDVFLIAVTSASTYDESCSILTWLCGIAKLRITDFYRRQSRQKRVPPENCVELDESISAISDDDDILGRMEATRLVDQVMSSLLDDEREVLLLRYVEEHSIREISHLMSRSEKAIESLLMRAKKKAIKSVGEW
jgi:RNA polymerase sigma-70 factor (ECF subfamily)